MHSVHVDPYMCNKRISQTDYQRHLPLWHNHDLIHHTDSVCDLSTSQPPLVCILVLSSAGVIERWELLQAQAVTEEQCYSRDREQLTSDLHDITSWLAQVIPELEKLQSAETASVSVQIMEARVKQLKVWADE